MNNIRKIIEERLENARNDYVKGKTDYLRGECLAYQDCLNLIPASRTEQEILKDFEVLGWKIVENDEFNLIMNNSNVFILDITKAGKIGAYTCYDTTKEQSALYITMQEHKLLNELFECYSWL